jgi:uncharacterized membrane protein required for colicin V production
MDSLFEHASLIFDVSAIVILLVFTILNARRGFARTFVSAVGYILAIIMAGAIGDASAEPIYNSILQSQNVKNVQEVLYDCDVSTAVRDEIKTQSYGVSVSADKLQSIIGSADSVYNTINKNGEAEILTEEEIDTLIVDSIDDELGEPLRTAFPSFTANYMINYMKSNEDTLYSTAQALLQEDKTATAEYIEETFVRPVVVYIIKMAIFFVVFFAVMVVVKIVAKTIENNNGTPNIFGTPDAILGAVLGIVEGCVMLVAICVVLKLVIFSNVNTSEILSDSVVQNTKLFKYIYNIDAVKLIR